MRLTRNFSRQAALSLRLLLVLLLATAGAPATRAAVPDPQRLPDPQSIVDELFGELKRKVIRDADQLQGWTDYVRAKAEEVARGFADCPSDAAQVIYDTLKDQRAKAAAVRDAAAQEEERARAARDACKRRAPAALCDATYNNLPFRGIRDSAAGVVATADGALGALRALRCARCDGRSEVAVTVPTFEGWRAAPQPPTGVEVCTRWEGGFKYVVGREGLSGDVRGLLPRCTRTERISFCDWDVNLLLPELKRLRVVPPEVGSVRIENVPWKTVRIVTGLTRGGCSEQLRVCTRVRGEFRASFDTGGDPVQALQRALASAEAHCEEKADLGCINPPFGLTPTTADIAVPDYTRARIVWDPPCGPSVSVEVDLTQQNFRFACKSTCAPPLPGVPVVAWGERIIRLPFICTNPQLVSVLKNP